MLWALKRDFSVTKYEYQVSVNGTLSRVLTIWVYWQNETSQKAIYGWERSNSQGQAQTCLDGNWTRRMESFVFSFEGTVGVCLHSTAGNIRHLSLATQAWGTGPIHACWEIWTKGPSWPSIAVTDTRKVRTCPLGKCVVWTSGSKRATVFPLSGPSHNWRRGQSEVVIRGCMRWTMPETWSSPKRSKTT